MKFTPRQGGRDMANVRITLSFAAEDLAEIKRLAREAGYDRDWRTWLRLEAADGVWGAILHNREDHKGGREHEPE